MAVEHPTDPAPYSPLAAPASIAPYMIIPNMAQLGRLERAELLDYLQRLLPGGWSRSQVAQAALLTAADPNPLLRGLEQAVDKAVYTAFFAGPAAVIWGYQTVLRLAGKAPEDSFPHGTWQFYVNYALREDTARHANETHGFDSATRAEGLALSAADRLAAWAMAAIQCLHQYDELLKNEWRERVYTALLSEAAANAPDGAVPPRLYADWVAQRPYALAADARPGESYPRYRQRRFNTFLRAALAGAGPEVRRRWLAAVRALAPRALPAYQAQMSLLAYLEPGFYADTARPISLSQAQVGVVSGGRYFLIPACQPGSERPAELATVRRQIAALLEQPPGHQPASLAPLARLRRAAFARLRPALNPALLDDLDLLRAAPILINADRRPRRLPLSELRQAERGAGDHALTIFDTGETLVFDQSHIFFDGTWGAALAEILTNEALGWARRLAALPPAAPAAAPPFAPELAFDDADRQLLSLAPTVKPEVAAESAAAELAALSAARQLLQRQSPPVHLTVNDLLVLYRAIHAATYRPAAALVADLELLAADPGCAPAAQAALDALEQARRPNPAILIPVDVSQRSPRDRLHTTSFEVPLDDLQLHKLHRQLTAWLAAPKGSAERPGRSGDEEQRLLAAARQRYLAALGSLARQLAATKEQAQRGESRSAAALKLLAHLPLAVQRLLNNIPEWFDVLNDLLKGREVLSNIGAVVSSSTLARFSAAKDDNEKKSLVWGVMTDAGGRMHVTLRDFRPHVALLAEAGQRHLAARMAADYLDAYVSGLNRFVGELSAIARLEPAQPAAEEAPAAPANPLGDYAARPA